MKKLLSSYSPPEEALLLSLTPLSKEKTDGLITPPLQKQNSKPKLLMHLCCAPCSPYILLELKKKYRVECFFYNPNIRPKSEYDTRYNELKRMLEGDEYQLPLHKGKYDTDRWDVLNGDLAHLPERSIRCENCIGLRLEEAARFAAEYGFDFFSTVLSVSPHKVLSQIEQAGEKGAEQYGVPFLYADFKKKNGYLYTTQKGKELELIRQNYCGCKPRGEQEVRV